MATGEAFLAIRRCICWIAQPQEKGRDMPFVGDTGHSIHSWFSTCAQVGPVRCSCNSIVSLGSAPYRRSQRPPPKGEKGGGGATTGSFGDKLCDGKHRSNAYLRWCRALSLCLQLARCCFATAVSNSQCQQLVQEHIIPACRMTVSVWAMIQVNTTAAHKPLPHICCLISRMWQPDAEMMQPADSTCQPRMRIQRQDQCDAC